MSNDTTGDWRHWLALRLVRGIGSVQGLSLVRAFGGPSAVFRASRQALECAGVRAEVRDSLRDFDQWAVVDEQIERLRACGGRLITWEDESYPENLRHIHDPPLFLFALGDFTPQDRLAVAVVGSRNATVYGRRMAAHLAEELARSGVTVVSGLARGIDAEAHFAALRAGGRTVAVLGCGLDVSYPTEHDRLKAQIARNGAVVSELFMATKPDAENFPTRNRIISGLSLGTVVVEAAEKSGSLISARYANEQGREVFAVPGPVSAATRGSHQLLRQGATLVESGEDILREIAPQVPSRSPQLAMPLLEGPEIQVFGQLAEAPMPVDEIIFRTGLTPAVVLDTLLQLELRGLVQQLPGKCYVRQRATGHA